LVATLATQSLRPVEERNRQMAIAGAAQASGQIGKATAALQRAVQADPWSADAVLWQADFYRWKLILQSDSPQQRRSWETCLDEAKARGGEDPAIYRMIAAQQLHLYQRYGRKSDLAAAAETLDQAVAWSPSNEWMMAQAAVVAEAQGERERAARLAARAVGLSKLGGNIERAISRQQVYLARRLGESARRGPVRAGADQLLPEPKSGR
jgi:Tfp pilus assembly protein PilF